MARYQGLVEEIGRRIDAAGGRVRSADLVADVLAAVPDVAESSVRGYMASLAFISERGTLRRRRDDDPLPAQPHWNTARGTFQHANTIRLALPVTSELLRGSAVQIPAATAAGAGVQPGERRNFGTAAGDVAIIWPLWSTNGPRLGTIRALAKSHGAQIGDTVVLIFDTAKETLTARRIPAGTTGEPLLELLLGTKRITLRSIATRLDCSPQDVHDILIRRGDTAVADVVTRVCQSPAPK